METSERTKPPSGAVSRLSLDIDSDVYQFLEELAEYRSALAEIQIEDAKKEGQKNVRPGKRPSRKEIAEGLVHDGAERLRGELKTMVDALGPIPGPVPDDEKKLSAYRKGMREYVKRMLEWEARGAK